MHVGVSAKVRRCPRCRFQGVEQCPADAHEGGGWRPLSAGANSRIGGGGESGPPLREKGDARCGDGSASGLHLGPDGALPTAGLRGPSSSCAAGVAAQEKGRRRGDSQHRRQEQAALANCVRRIRQGCIGASQSDRCGSGGLRSLWYAGTDGSCKGDGGCRTLGRISRGASRKGQALQAVLTTRSFSDTRR